MTESHEVTFGTAGTSSTGATESGGATGASRQGSSAAPPAPGTLAATAAAGPAPGPGAPAATAGRDAGAPGSARLPRGGRLARLAKEHPITVLATGVAASLLFGGEFAVGAVVGIGAAALLLRKPAAKTGEPAAKTGEPAAGAGGAAEAVRSWRDRALQLWEKGKELVASEMKGHGAGPGGAAEGGAPPPSGSLSGGGPPAKPA